MTLDCFVCGKRLMPAVNLTEDAGDVVPPYGGTRFESHGNYGSTVLDPPPSLSTGDREFMEINICDPCLLAAAADGRVAYGRSRVQVQVTWETFDPEVHNP